MAPKVFQPAFNPSKTRHFYEQNLSESLVKNVFSFRQLLLFGALAQAAASAVLPLRYAVLPALLFLLHQVVTVVIEMRAAKNPWMNGVVSGRAAAALPNDSYDPRATGEEGRTEGTLFGSKPAKDGVVVFHLGARFNHPLGALGPGGAGFIETFTSCNERLLETAKEYGCIGMTAWTASERERSNTLMYIYYFRSIEGLNAFSKDPVHLKAWDWYNHAAKKLGYTHLGIFHETFYSGPGQYETIYDYMHPLLMGAGSVPGIKNEATGQEDWVRPLVKANVPVLRSQMGRLGQKKVQDNGDAYDEDLVMELS